VTDEQPTNRTVLGVPLHTAIASATIFAFIVLWELLAQVAYTRLAIVFPSLATIVVSLVELLTSREFYSHFALTAYEVAVSFALAAVVGIVGGTILGMNEFLADAMEPLIYYFSTVPKIVLYPLFLVVLGVGFESKVAMGFFSALFPITVNMITGALNVREDLVKVARAHRASVWQVFKHIYLPSTVTHIVNGLRLGIGVAIIGVLLGELAASQAGLGNQVQFYFSNLQTAKMYAVLTLVFAASFGLNLTLLRFQQFLRAKGYGVGQTGEAIGF
jgi:ABC-type nitrate/sulfonate/bicarbonate transport system permease component